MLFPIIPIPFSIGKYGLLFYNSLLMLPLSVLIAYNTGDLSRVYNFEGWRSSVHTDDSISKNGK